MRQHFRVALWTDLVEVHWYDHGQVVITPIGHDEVCVSVLTNKAHRLCVGSLDLHPEVGRRLAHAPASSPPRGAICSASIMRSVVRRHVVLIGDAAGTMDAITGEGLSFGFRQAVNLAAALAAGNIQRYEDAHHRLRRLSILMGKLMLAIGSRPGLRHRLLCAFAAQPSLLSFALAVHTGALPISALPLGPMMGFLHRLVIDGLFPAEAPSPM